MIQELDTNEMNKILIQNKNFQFTKIMKHKYKIDFSITNNRIHLDKIIHFSLIKLMYQVNKNHFETMHMDIVDDDNAYLYILLKPILKELGFSQRYVSLKFIKYSNSEKNKIFLKGIFYSDYGEKINQCKNAIPLPIEEINIICTIINPHKIQLTKNISFQENFNMPIFFEKIFGTLLKSIYKPFINTLEKYEINGC